MKILKKVKRFIKIFYYKTLCLILHPKDNQLDPYEGVPFKKRLTKLVPGSKNSAVYLIVSGEFSSTKFHSWVKRRGRLNNLESWAIKRSDHLVKVILIGEGSKIDNVINLVWMGPINSKVTNVKEFWFNKPTKINIDNSLLEMEYFDREEMTKPIIDTLDYLSPLLKRPNSFTNESELSQTMLLKQAASEKNLVFIGGLRQNYLIGPQTRIGFSHSECTCVNTLVSSIADNKKVTKEYFKALGLPVPKGEVFTDYKDAEIFFDKISGGVVVKPVEGSQGSGVSVNIRSLESFKIAWDYAKEHHEQVIVEEFVNGVDVRVLIVGGKAYAAFIRVPANVVGDGKKTIEELIQGKNTSRHDNPRLSRKLIIYDDYMSYFLQCQGYSLDTVPKRGEVVLLHMKANLSTGGDSIAITERIHPDLMKLSEEVASALGTTEYWGIDLMVQRIDLPRQEQSCCIIEVNSRAGLRGIQWPMYGERKFLTKDLVESLFPECTDDVCYEKVSLRIQVTGLINEEFYELVNELSEELQIESQVLVKHNSAEIILQGYKNKAYTFYDRLWGIKNKNFLLYSVRIVTEQKDIILKDPIDTNIMNKQEFNIYNLNINNYTLNLDKCNNELLDLELFVEGFDKCGFHATPLGNGLIKLTKGNREGITSIRHSTHYADNVTQKIHLANKLLSMAGLPTPKRVHLKSNSLKKGLIFFRDINKKCVFTSLNPNKIESNLIYTESDLKSSWKKAFKKGTNYMLIQEYVEGWMVQVPVVKGKAVCAFAVEDTCEDKTANISDLINPAFYKYAEKAVASIPGLQLGVVEMVIPHPNRNESNQNWIVYKIDTAPSVSKFHFPWRGKPFELAGKIIEDLCLEEGSQWFRS